MNRSINNPRLNSVLGDNELREYFSGKRESARSFVVEHTEKHLYQCGKGFHEKTRVLLLSPTISIPCEMPKRCIPPLGISYVAASLVKFGCEVSIIDCCVEGYENEEEADGLVTYGLSGKGLWLKLQGFDPHLIGISILFSTDLINALRICSICKEVFPDVPIVLGGLHPTIYPKEIFELGLEVNNGTLCFDWIIRGEGEFRMVEFVSLLRAGVMDRNLDGLAGLIDGNIFVNPQVERISNLDSIPFPAYDLLPMEKYFEINVPFSPAPEGTRVCQILTSRGCPVGCTFCASTNMYKEYRFRSVVNVIAEINFLKKRYHIDEIQFADDNLTFNKQHTIELMRALKNVTLPWCTPNGTMVNTLTPDLLQAMHDAGLYQITISLDSGSAKTLKNLHHKPVNLQSIPQLIATCKSLGVWTHGTLVVGMPGESLTDLQDGLRFIMENLTFDSVSTFIANPIPGSELYHQALEKGLISKENARNIDTTRAKMVTGISPEVLEKTAFDFQREFTQKAIARNPKGYQQRYSRLRSIADFTEDHGGRLA